MKKLAGETVPDRLTPLQPTQHIISTPTMHLEVAFLICRFKQPHGLHHSHAINRHKQPARYFRPRRKMRVLTCTNI